MLKYVYYTYTLCNTFFKNVTIFLCVWKIALTLLFIKSKPGSDLDPAFISSDPAKKIPKPDLIRIWTAAKITTLTNCICSCDGGFRHDEHDLHPVEQPVQHVLLPHPLVVVDSPRLHLIHWPSLQV